MLKSFLKRVDKRIFRPFRDRYSKTLEKEVIGTGCESLLDIGCGSNSPVKWFSHKLKHSVGVDAHEPSLQKSQKLGIHQEYKKVEDLLSLDKSFPPKSFDAVLASDLIEHLSKNDGEKLIAVMEKLAKKKVIIFTPNGFLPQTPYDDNKFQAHISGWEVEEMQAKGYQVYGLSGWRPLKGERAELKWWPKRLWERLSLFTEIVLVNNPKHSFEILCIKNVS